ncbi:phage tail sheath subtilisin-like domain-containing protein [Hyalangium versicolor]|uniref:phage tail sheath subtilisin-like domain-containing protein n=1 Tax=Hyalangium versicolor TaxID=2861190 RepID=UPI001CCC31E3|nr:phage tail sheath subtilisin-like domain-containing protein [Hyalangium versicolor]
MPEYLAPGVYVEEVSFRSKSIEGVPTSTTGFVGVTRFGPVQYADGPKTTEPRLITSFTEFESVYGGLEPLAVGATALTAEEHLPYTAHAARAFFLNGGARLYVSRVFVPRSGTDLGIASTSVQVGSTTAKWKARWPGSFGNVWVDSQVVRSKNIAYIDNDLGGIVQVRRAKKGAVVEIITSGTPPTGNAPLVIGNLAQVDIDGDGKQVFVRGGATVTPNVTDIIQLVELRVLVKVTPERTSFYDELGADPAQTRYVGKILQKDDPEDENAVIWLDYDPDLAGDDAAAKLMVALQGNTTKRLTGGNDGQMPAPSDLAGSAADPDNASIKATGLEALGEIEDIAIVAAPDSGTYEDEDLCAAATDALIRHAEAQRYRIAVVDAPAHSSISKVREFRGRFDSKYAALYHPWIEILDPTQRPAQGAPPDRLLLPPSGFVTGIYARSDIERGVHKAPANEVVNGLTKFELNINKPRQDVLNPEGINALRFFEGRGNRVWGARTMSSDPEWKYVNVRRLFIYLEHSIDKGTQWAVFEPNNERLWANVRQTIEDFLYVLWKDGALLGTKPEEAYFVRCDRTTMTQNDLDNGRLICLIGVAPTKPAEFVIFRIGQYTANAKA